VFVRFVACKTCTNSILYDLSWLAGPMDEGPDLDLGNCEFFTSSVYISEWQKDHEFEASLAYRARPCLTGVRWGHSSSNKTL
jgi:hypothetical protein